MIANLLGILVYWLLRIANARLPMDRSIDGSWRDQEEVRTQRQWLVLR
jgi:hypothetical protein